jgi:hypothetical protein
MAQRAGSIGGNHMRSRELVINQGVKVYRIWLKFYWEQEVFDFQKIKKPYVRAQGDLPQISTKRLWKILKRRKYKC